MKIKKVFAALALCLVVSGSSFGAKHVVKGTGKTLKFLF